MATIVLDLPKPSLVLNGTATVTGSIKFAAPIFPDEVTQWDSVVLTGTWGWTGKGSPSNFTIGGETTSRDIEFSHTLTSSELSSGSIPLSVRGGNKNCTGDFLTWTGLKITFTYTKPIHTTLYVKRGGSWVPVTSAYKKVSGVWVKQDDITSVFQEGVKLRQVVIGTPLYVNLFDSSKPGYIDGGLLNTSNVFGGWAPGAVTNYMPVNSNYKYRIIEAANSWDKLFYYDADYNFLECTHSLSYEEHDFEIGVGTSYPIPEAAVYIRVNMMKDVGFSFTRIA